jgi:hypothetical protein
MSATALDATLRDLKGRLAHPPAAGSFGEGELQGLPDPVCRYFRTSIAAGTPLARSARLGMSDQPRPAHRRTARFTQRSVSRAGWDRPCSPIDPTMRIIQ